MENQIVIVSSDGTVPRTCAAEGLAGSRRRRSARVIWVNDDIRKTSTNWPNKAHRGRPRPLLASEPASTSASLPSPTGSMASASIRPMTETPGATDVKDTANAGPSCPTAPAGRRPGLLPRGADDLLDGRALRVDAAVASGGGDRSIWVKSTASTRREHLAEEDEFISKPAQAEIALAGKPNATVYRYPGQYHAFARHNGAHYNAAAAALANGRTTEFLHQQLQ